MPMHEMDMDQMQTIAGPAGEMTMDDQASSEAITPPAILIHEERLADQVDSPTHECPHCWEHSGPVNSPPSLIGALDQGSDVSFVPLPVPGFLIRPAAAALRVGLPRAHAPPGDPVPRHILLNTFLI